MSRATTGIERVAYEVYKRAARTCRLFCTRSKALGLSFNQLNHLCFKINVFDFQESVFHLYVKEAQ